MATRADLNTKVIAAKAITGSAVGWATAVLALLDDAFATSKTPFGSASERDVGTAAGNVPAVGANGKLDLSILPSQAIGPYRTLDIPAKTWSAAVSNGADDEAVISDADNSSPDISVVAFDDSTAEVAEVDFELPNTYAGGTIRARVTWTSAAASGTVRWGLSAVAIGDNVAIASNYGTEVVVDDSTDGANEQRVSDQSPEITIANAGTNKRIYLKLRRVAAASEDTLSGDARMISVEIDWS